MLVYSLSDCFQGNAPKHVRRRPDCDWSSEAVEKERALRVSHFFLCFPMRSSFLLVKRQNKENKDELALVLCPLQTSVPYF